MNLIPVLYVCLRVLPAVPCPIDQATVEIGGNVLCNDEPIAEHEFRTRLVKPVPDCATITGQSCLIFTDGDWTCYPLLEGSKP